MGYKEDFIEFLVRSEALAFGSFITKSGRLSPYFVNTGKFETGERIAELGRYYAACLRDHITDGPDALFGPAYKGIPLCVSTAIALYRDYHLDVPYCFDRKQEKDHGEGGILVGYRPKAGDRITIIDDVVTAGTSVRTSIPRLKVIAEVYVPSLVVSVDRLEKGRGDRTALEELRDEFGIETYAIVTVKDIIAHLHNRPIGGQVLLTDEIKARLDEYMARYCV